MAAQYAHIQFFRRVPAEYLKQYFESKSIKLGDFKTLNKPELLFAAFLRLSEEQQSNIETDFQDINAMAGECGVRALVDEARFHGDDAFTETIAVIDGFHGKAMWAFLEKKDYWLGASMFLHADNVSASYWKKRNDLPNTQPHVEEDDIEILAKAISHFFYEKEARGRNCKVEPYRRGNKEYFFAYPEDFGQSGVEWESDTLRTRSRHPAFEIIFVYCEEAGSLDIYAPKNTKAVPNLQRIFVQSILKLDVLPDGKVDERVYDLRPLEDSNFEFQIEPESGIKSIVVTQIRLNLKNGNKKRITLEADTKNNAKAVYDLLKQLELPAYDITQVRLKATLEPTAGSKRAKTRTFNITYPNSCALNYEGNDGVIRDMLAKSGIEPAKV